MYDELIKRLRETSIDFGKSDHVSVMMIEAADAIEGLSHAVDQMTEWRKNRWIPVTERLPEDRQRVLVFYWLKLKPKVPWHKVCYFASKLNKVDKYDFDGCNRPRFYDCDSEYGYYELEDVTHWMPLPEPPEDGES